MKKTIAAMFIIICTVVALSVHAGASGRTKLPVLMYHHFAGEASADTIVSGRKFREQMTAVQKAGYTAVTLDQVLDFVDNGTPLPDKPVLITMDDGYTRNLEIAAPVLEELGMCATVFVIGINEGEEIYVHTGEPLCPARFSYEDAADWVKKGVLNLQCHTMDMHQLECYGCSGRDGMLPLDGESDMEYRRAVREDMRQFRQRRAGRVSTPLNALAYPFGYYSEELDSLLEEQGIVFTFTVDEHCNMLCTGDRSSLRMMGRFNVTERMSGQALVERLNLALRTG